MWDDKKYHIPVTIVRNDVNVSVLYELDQILVDELVNLLKTMEQ